MAAADDGQGRPPTSGGAEPADDAGTSQQGGAGDSTEAPVEAADAPQQANAVSGPVNDPSPADSGLSATLLLVLLLGGTTVSALVGLGALWWRIRAAAQDSRAVG